MKHAKRIITAGGTFLCILGIGFIMQNGESHASVSATTVQPQNRANAVQDTVSSAKPAEMQKASQPAAVQSASILPLLPQAGQQPATLAMPDETRVVAPDTPIAPMPEEEATPGFSCELALNAETVAAAMVELELSAPCLANERFTLHHNGMMFTEITDEDGRRKLTVPALAEQAVFIVAFAGGEGAVANTEVTSLEYYDRVVVQWKGRAGLQIHAREFESDYGEAGHVWADAARELASAVRGEGGFLTRHGAEDAPEGLVAEVYTFPTGMSARNGAVQLSVEAEVTDQNCGRDIEAQSIQTTTEKTLKVQEVVLAVPGCDAIGDFLVLKNLLNDLKIASR